MAITDDTKIKMDNGNEFTVKELKDNYQKQDVYARNMAALMKEECELADEKRQFQRRCDKLAGFLGSLIPDAPDPALKKTNPKEYAEQTEFREQAKNEMSRFYAIRDDTEVEEARAERMRYKAGEQKNLVTAFPRLEDPDVWEEFFVDIRRTASKIGFSAQEFSETYDHRIFKMLHYAGIGLREAQPGDGGSDMAN